MTYIWTWGGRLFLTAIVDVFSRRVVGWAMDGHLRTELPLEALGMALGIRQPERGSSTTRIVAVRMRGSSIEPSGPLAASSAA